MLIDTRPKFKFFRANILKVWASVPIMLRKQFILFDTAISLVFLLKKVKGLLFRIILCS